MTRTTTFRRGATVAMTAAMVAGLATAGASAASAATALDNERSPILLEQTAHLNDTNGNGGADVGETITYSYGVRNNTDRSAFVSSVSAPGGALRCGTGLVPAGGLLDCGVTVDRVVSLADMRDQAVTTDAAALVFSTAYGVLQPTASTSTPVALPALVQPEQPAAEPAISIAYDATLDDANRDGLASIAESLDYTLSVTNTGTTRLENIAVTLDRGGDVTCDVTGLNPGESTTCAVPSRTVGLGDLRALDIVSTATVTADAPTHVQVSASDSAAVSVYQGR